MKIRIKPNPKVRCTHCAHFKVLLQGELSGLLYKT